MKATSIKCAACHDKFQCAGEQRDEFPTLPSPGVNPSAIGGQAAGKSNALVKTSLGKGQAAESSNAFVNLSPGEGQATEKSNAFVKTGHSRWSRNGESRQGHHD